MWPHIDTRSIQRTRSPGQILVLFAMVMTILLGMVGAGVDYGFILVEDTNLQNSLDAAALAGARSLVSGNNPGTASADAAARAYLTLHGYTHGVNSTTVNISFPPSANNANDTVVISVQRVRPAFFWRVFNINSVTVRGTATAIASRGMVDIVLSLDLTGSMRLSGGEDEDNLREAVEGFINTMNPSPSDPRGPRIGIHYFAGMGCSWRRGVNGGGQGGDGNAYVDLTGTIEYTTPCQRRYGRLSSLPNDKAALLKIANNVGGMTCPVSGVHRPFACPLTAEWPATGTGYSPTPITGTPTPIAGYAVNNNNQNSTGWPGFTGTRISNGIEAVNRTGYHAWSTSEGGRNNAAGEGWARKVLILMTDGVNQLYPTTGNPLAPGAPDSWDTEMTSMADALARGPDGVIGTLDDVEVYTVGFFCTPYSASSDYCQSRMAGATPHPCPSATLGGNPSEIDTLLINVSASRAGSCDHYYPVRKTESLSVLFNQLAGAISRGRLTN